MPLSPCFALAKVAAEPSKWVSVSRNEKRVSYGTVLNTCLSFSNEVKNLAKIARFKCVFLYPLAGFFAKSHMIFFLSSSFRFCPPLKNDGRGVFVLP